MASLSFIRRDFEVFAIEGFSARMEKIYEHVRPRLVRLGAELAPELSRKLHADFFPHVAKHTRRIANPPGETWTAWGPSASGYMRYPHLALCISGLGIHARAIVKAEAEHRAEMGRMLKASSSALEKSFRGSRIQRYEKWDFIKMPKAIVANAGLFDALGAALEGKTGTIDVGFGWPWRAAIELEVDEVLDAFGELGPLYDVLSR
jgi:uncharacterized protein YktB (UPF0637 family)